GASNLAPFFRQSLKALWLIDSVTLTLASIFSLAALSPSYISGLVVELLAFVPMGTGILLYIFLGRFGPAHLLLAAGALALAGGLLPTICPKEAKQTTANRRDANI